MKDQALAAIEGITDPNQALNRLREYLQAMILRSFHESEAFRNIAFVGGTALRFLHGLPRFSEDLDFSRIDDADLAGAEWLTKVKRDLTLAGFTPEVTWNDRKTVHTGWIRMSGILHEAGLSGLPDQKLSIKVEIDTRPPTGARWERRLVNRFFPFMLQYYDLPSLLAGKLHAAITRKYAKGRDWYDLLWYRTQVPPVKPNLLFLQNALDQTQGPGEFSAPAWGQLVRDRLEVLDFAALAKDVQPFLERVQDAEFLTRENLLDLLPTA